jgi:hypothetical protein
MTKYTVELWSGGMGSHVEIDASGMKDAWKQARAMASPPYVTVVEVRQFARAARHPRLPSAPEITVKPDPFAVLQNLLFEKEG